MLEINTQAIIEPAILEIEKNSRLETDGRWLENLTAQVAPFLKDWDISHCYSWADWSERTKVFPDSTSTDVGIDLVARRRSDKRYVAIQCKARRLDDAGLGNPITKEETDSFVAASSGAFWAERWIVTNGNTRLSSNAEQVFRIGQGQPLKLINIANDLLQERRESISEDCRHCEPNPNHEERIQTKTCMQKEAVARSVAVLRAHAETDSGGLPKGQARGKIILPCGTGKTRISLRIVEELTPPGDLAIVLCPSIALVSQIRREYLQHTNAEIRPLVVCSDQTAGYDPRREDNSQRAVDPTRDSSNVSASEVKGLVTTDAGEIAKWIEQGKGTDYLNVIFGTYQSAYRIAEALKMTKIKLSVLIADEAHRTAGLRPNKGGSKQAIEQEERIRNFARCHDQDAFPAAYRVYQTATPRIYDTSRVIKDNPSDYLVRSMDDAAVFGVELYRKSYVEAVRNGWLADYRIIALGINDPEAYEQANQLARIAQHTHKDGARAATSAGYLRGLAFALGMGGAIHSEEGAEVPIKSCIAFMNTVVKSKAMARDLQSKAVRQWVQNWIETNGDDQPVANYRLEHLDATSNVAARDNAKRLLAQADNRNPHGIINVGIFGEGTDAPTLSAVAFLEPRKSPIDVIQAVGRAMRTAPGKNLGYIICPVIIPPNADPERWLSISSNAEGWQELGQILLALRAHDQRIEDNLADLLKIYVPATPDRLDSIVAIAINDGESQGIWYGQHEGVPGAVEDAIERVLTGDSNPEAVFAPYEPVQKPIGVVAEPTAIYTGKRTTDGNIELRTDSVVRFKPANDGAIGAVDYAKCRVKAQDIINQGEGRKLPSKVDRNSPEKHPVPLAERAGQRMLDLTDLSEYGNAIRMNLLEKSGLAENRIMRDLNILENSIREAAYHLRADALSNALDRHFGLDKLNEEARSSQADGCTIAALLVMNASMLHQRISNGGWLAGISDLANIKNDTKIIRGINREWSRIISHDFLPVIEPALKVIQAIEDTGKTSGLERALRHIAAEAERIAETYADMGADHAGPLFNRVMGNQASDGAFFTRPLAASLAARLALDACGGVDWADPQVWRQHKTVDLACGSGTLLAAMLTDMKRRAAEQGADSHRLAELQKVGVEETIKGLDINPVSLQLAASQLTTGNQNIRYRRMGLFRMPYGPQRDNPERVSVGTLELLGSKDILARPGELGLADEAINSQSVWNSYEETELEGAVEAVKDARIVIMNPPFTNRIKMGEKFPAEEQKRLRKRVDAMEKLLAKADAEMAQFADKNSIEYLFTALADHCSNHDDGILALINPTIALSATSGGRKRRILAQRFHIDTILTCHQPGQTNLSQNTGINESIIVARRHTSTPPPPPPPPPTFNPVHPPGQVSDGRSGCRRFPPLLVGVRRRPDGKRLGRSFLVAGGTHLGRRLDARYLPLAATGRSGGGIRLTS